MKKSLLTLAATIAALGLGTTIGNAQSVWNGGAGNWSSNAATGWNGTGVPNVIDRTADATAAGGTITVDGNFTLGTLTQSGTQSRSLNTATGGTLIFDVTSGNALWDMSTGLSGTGISGGTSHSTNITLNDNLEIRGLVSNSSTSPTFSGKISGAGQLLLTNVATTPSSGGVRVSLNNATNDFSGGINVGNGVGLRLNASGAAGSGTITLADTTNGGNNLDFRVDTANATQVHANTINFGTRVSGGATVLSLQNSTMTVTLNGVLSGTMATGRVSLNGGTLVLGGASPNTWTGQFRSDTHGTLIADKVGAISNGFSMRSSTANTQTSLLVGVSDTLTGQISVDGSNSGAAQSYTVQIGLKDGNNGTVTFNNGSKINLNNAYGNGGTVGTPTTSLNLHSGNGTGTLNITTEIGTNALPATARNISITGTGTVNLSRLVGNTYGGTTTVSSGTLLVSNTSNSATSTGAVTVSSGATLGGTGSVSGATSVTGSLMAGDGLTSAAGTLTLGGDLSMLSTSTLVFELGGSFAHSILARTGSGTWSFDSIQQVRFVDFGAATGTYSGLITGLAGDPGSLASWTISNAGWAGTFSYNSGSVDLNLTAVPEPSTFAMLLGGLGALALLRRRRRA